MEQSPAMIVLFDVDGVLVHHRAYHLGLQKTVAYFSRRLGAGEHTLTQAEIDEFEAQSVTVEWESSAISVAALLLARLAAGPRLEAALAGDFWRALAALEREPQPVARPDFRALARRVGAATPPGSKPSQAAWQLFEADLRGVPWADLARRLLRPLLADCYNVDASPTHQVFQNYVIGQAVYAEVYGLAPHFEHPALLATEDKPCLSPAWRTRLLTARAAGQVYLSLYTARPSRPPVEVAERLRGYTPEAEMALTLAGLEADGPERVPIIAFGKLEWAARQAGRTVKELVKPSPVQALAAIAAARTGRERDALDAALAVERGEPLPALYAACAGQTVHVFEDSASSLRAATRAVEALNGRGLGLTLTRHGIAPAGSPKRDTLAQIADHLHVDVNAGLGLILADTEGQARNPLRYPAGQ
jgi:hypothetical protein